MTLRNNFSCFNCSFWLAVIFALLSFPYFCNVSVDRLDCFRHLRTGRKINEIANDTCKTNNHCSQYDSLLFNLLFQSGYFTDEMAICRL